MPSLLHLLHQIQTTFLSPKKLLVALSARMMLPPATVSHEAALVGVHPAFPPCIQPLGASPALV